MSLRVRANVQSSSGRDKTVWGEQTSACELAHNMKRTLSASSSTGISTVGRSLPVSADSSSSPLGGLSAEAAMSRAHETAERPQQADAIETKRYRVGAHEFLKGKCARVPCAKLSAPESLPTAPGAPSKTSQLPRMRDANHAILENRRPTTNERDNTRSRRCI